MPAVMTIPELERFLAAEFPQAFYPESGLSIEAVWDGGCLGRLPDFRYASLTLALPAYYRHMLQY